jgi:hypothetical protein
LLGHRARPAQEAVASYLEKDISEWARGQVPLPGLAFVWCLLRRFQPSPGEAAAVVLGEGPMSDQNSASLPRQAFQGPLHL